MAYTFNLGINQASSCDYIQIADNSTFTNPSTREDYGIALHYFKDDVYEGADYTNPGSTSAFGEWFIPASKGNYEIKAYFIPVWTEAGSFSTNGVVGDFGDGGDGNFYVALGSVSPSALHPYQDPDNWTLIEANEAGYTTMSSAGNLLDTIDLFSEVDCNAYIVTKIECHVYSIFDNSGLDEATAYTVVDYKGDSVLSGTIAIGESTEITMPADGVYTLTIGDFQKRIIDICNLKTCVETMIAGVINKCDDPCTQNCDTNCQNQVNIYRNELNKVIALYYPLLGMVYSDAVLNIGITTVDESEEDNSYQIGELITKLTDITSRCGLCTDTNTTSDCGC